MPEKSLQLNINSVDDARSVVAYLSQIKAAYDAHECTSVEMCIAEGVVTATAPILMGAIPWCVTYRKIVKPFEGNVAFTLPHYQGRPVTVTVPGEPVQGKPVPKREPAPEPATESAVEPVAVSSTIEDPRPAKRHMRQSPFAKPPTHGNTAALVQPSTGAA